MNLSELKASMELTQILMTPHVDLVRVAELINELAPHSLARSRAMYYAVHMGPKVPRTDNTYLHAVELMTRLGVPLPPAAAWLAYADELSVPKANLQAQEMTRLVVRLGGKGGLRYLRLRAAFYMPQALPHDAFLAALEVA